ncbi:MAG: lipase, partial [Thermoleophilaceae bacterium]|nr:lipase [Thermoleophilaceae bacterium]
RGTSDCSEAGAQQAANSDFIRALNSRSETFESISYTEVYTKLDEVVTPPREAASVGGPGDITNVAIQDICPAATAEHLAVGTIDPAAAALALDALAHKGPADPARIDPLVCLQPVQPGVDPITGPPQVLAALNNLFIEGGPSGPEPRLRCYVFKKGCPDKAR